MVVTIANQKIEDCHIGFIDPNEDPTIIPDTDNGKVRNLAAEIHALLLGIC